MGARLLFKLYLVNYVDFVKFLNQENINVSIDNNSTKYKSVILLRKTLCKFLADREPFILQNHNNYVWTYFNSTKILRKNTYWSIDGVKILQKLIALNTKCGYKLKAFKLFSYVLNYIYSYFINFNKTIYDEYPTYATFWGFSNSFPEEFYKPDFLLRYIYLYLELIFIIKRAKPKKKIKKKKIQLRTVISYLPIKSRATITIRLINAYINSSLAKTNIIRLGDALIYLIFTGKNSFLYKKKLSMYERILEKKKFY